MRVFVPLLVAALLAGCASPGAEREDAPREAEHAEPVVRAPLRVELTLDKDWARPGEAVAATATPHDGATYRWFLARADGTAPAGSGASTDGEVPALPGPSWTDVSLAPLGSASTRLDLAGRYAIAVGNAPMNATVEAGAPTEANATLIVDAWGPRVVPDEVALAPGGTLTIASVVDRALTARLGAFWHPIDAGGAARDVVPQHQGRLLVVALVDAPGARGLATAPLFVDPLKPDEQVSYGPFEGSFTTPVGAEPVEHALRSDYAMRSLAVTFSAASQLAGGPARIRVTLVLPDGTESTPVEGASGEILQEGVPAGATTIRVEPLEGALVDYALRAEATLRLDAPARDTTSGGHEHGSVIDPCQPPGARDC